MPLPEYLTTVDIPSCTSIKTNPTSNAICAIFKFNGIDVSAVIDVFTCNVFDQFLSITLNGVMFDEIEVDQEVINWYHSLEFRALYLSSAQETRDAKLVEAIVRRNS